MRVFFSLLVYGLAAGATCRGEIQLVGVISGAEKRLFALSDSSSGSSSWRSLGETFAEYRLSNYDADASTLVLTKNAESLKIKLTDAAIKTADSTPPPPSASNLDALSGIDLAYALAEQENVRVSELLVRYSEVKKVQEQAKKEMADLEADLAKNGPDKDKQQALEVKKQALTGTTNASDFLQKQLVTVAAEEREKLKKQDK